MHKRRTRPRSEDSDSDDDSDDHRHPSKFNITTIDNTIYFNEDITHKTVFQLNVALRKLEKKLLSHGSGFGEILRHELERRNMPPPPNLEAMMGSVPIRLHVTTYGGLVDAAFSAVDCIKGLKVPVVTVVDGYVASAGTLITLAGTRRLMLPNASMMIHELRTTIWGKMKDLTDSYENSAKTMEHLVEFYNAHTKLSKKKLEKTLQRDVNWRAEECLKHGLVDEVLKAGAEDEE